LNRLYKEVYGDFNACVSIQQQKYNTLNMKISVLYVLMLPICLKKHLQL